jgi:hypothetical protein
MPLRGIPFKYLLYLSFFRGVVMPSNVGVFELKVEARRRADPSKKGGTYDSIVKRLIGFYGKNYKKGG